MISKERRQELLAKFRMAIARSLEPFAKYGMKEDIPGAVEAIELAALLLHQRLSSDNKQEPVLTREICKECGVAGIVVQEGCKVCKSCGWSECS